MFSVEPINLSHYNGFHTMIMQSSEDKTRLIAAFKRYIDMGYNPNDVIDRVFRETHVNESDLLDEDVKTINRTIEKYYKEKRGGR